MLDLPNIIFKEKVNNMKIDIDPKTAEKLIEVLKQVTEEENEVEQETEDRVIQGATKEPKRQRSRRRKKAKSGTEGKKEIRCRVERIETGSKENKFWDLTDSRSKKEAEKHKRDTKTDKKLAGDYQKRKRRPRTRTVEAECSKCNDLFDVSPSLIVPGIDFVCDDCCRK